MPSGRLLSGSQVQDQGAAAEPVPSPESVPAVRLDGLPSGSSPLGRTNGSDLVSTAPTDKARSRCAGSARALATLPKAKGICTKNVCRSGGKREHF